MAAEFHGKGVAINTLAPVAAVMTPGVYAKGIADFIEGDSMKEPVEAMAEAALLLSSCDPEKVTGRITYSGGATCRVRDAKCAHWMGPRFSADRQITTSSAQLSDVGQGHRTKRENFRLDALRACRQVGEFRVALLRFGLERFRHLRGAKHPGLPSRNMLEAFLDRVIPRVVEHFFRAPDGERRLTRDLFCDLKDTLDQTSMIVPDLIDQADLKSLVRREPTTRVSEFTHHPGRNQMRKALQGADVCRHPDIDFLDTEKGIS